MKDTAETETVSSVSGWEMLLLQAVLRGASLDISFFSPHAGK